MRFKAEFRSLSIALLVAVLSACSPMASSNEGVTGSLEGTATEPQPTPLPSFSLDAMEAGTMQAHSFLSSAGQELSYLIHIPEDYHQQASWPLILSLHGDQGRRHTIDDVRIMNPLFSLEPGAEFPFILVAPLSRTGAWNVYRQSMNELLDNLVDTLTVDPEAIILAGFSAGGYGAWHYALANPERFAALAIIAGDPGGTGAPEGICSLRDMPIWITHSEADAIISIDLTLATIDALHDCGNDSITVITYSDLEHIDSINVSYADPDLYQWMLEQVE